MNEETLKEAHKYSFRNKNEISISNLCGCFHCKATYIPTEIKEFVDDGQTAICPYCSVDSVIGSSSHELTPEFLEEMSDYWFSRIVNPTTGQKYKYDKTLNKFVPEN